MEYNLGAGYGATRATGLRGYGTQAAAWRAVTEFMNGTDPV